MDETPEDDSRDPMGFRALRRRWRAAPRQEPPIFDSPDVEARMLDALEADFDAALVDPDLVEFMKAEGPRRLVETVARVARWRRAFAELDP